MGKRTLLLAALLTLLLAVPATAQLRYVGDRGVSTVGKVKCPVGVRCVVKTPKAVKTKIGRRSFWAKVRAPKRVASGKRGTLRVKFGGRALTELRGRTTTVKVRVVLRRPGKGLRKMRLRARVRRAALAGQPGLPGTPGAPGAPTSGPVGNEPPLLARPATAVDVSGVQVTWYPRDSWMRYVASGQGTTLSGGASGVLSEQSPCPDTAGKLPLPYTIGFVPRPSWFDPVSGVAGLYGSGTAHFGFASHGIDFSASDPEVEINGAASRLIMRLNGTGATAIPNQRVSFTTLDMTGQPTTAPANPAAGGTYTYSLVRGNLADDGTNVFANFYPPKAPFGCVSVSFTVPPTGP